MQASLAPQSAKGGEFPLLSTPDFLPGTSINLAKTGDLS